MNIEEGPFDPVNSVESKPTEQPRSWRTLSPFVFGWIATAAILTGYGIGSSLILSLLADSISSEGIEISTPNLFTASIIGQFLFLLLPAFFFARRGPLPLRETLRLRSAPVAFFLLASIGMIACQFLGTLWLVVQELYLVPDSLLSGYHELQQSAEWLHEHLRFGPNIPLLLFALLAIAIVPALSEELVFRGIVQRSFEERLRPVAAIALASIIFGLIHFQPTNFIPLAGVGAFLGLTAWASRSIWPGVFGHFFFNSVQVILPNLSGVSLDEMERTPTTSDFYALLPFALISLIVLTSIIRQMRRMRES